MLKPEGAPLGTPRPASAPASKPARDATTGGERSDLDDRPRRVKDQFVRRRAVEVGARLGSTRALALGLTDTASEVRAAALREIGKLSGKFALAFGADSAEESKVRKVALAWLVEKRAWPIE
jgi:hypothetical protein